MGARFPNARFLLSSGRRGRCRAVPPVLVDTSSSWLLLSPADREVIRVEEEAERAAARARRIADARVQAAQRRRDQELSRVALAISEGRPFLEGGLPGVRKSLFEYSQGGVDLVRSWLADHPPYVNFTTGLVFVDWEPDEEENSLGLRLQIAPPPVCAPAGVYVIWSYAHSVWTPPLTELEFGHYWLPQLSAEELRLRSRADPILGALLTAEVLPPVEYTLLPILQTITKDLSAYIPQCLPSPITVLREFTRG